MVRSTQNVILSGAKNLKFMLGILYYSFSDLLGWNVMEAKNFRFFVASLLRMTGELCSSE